MAEILGTLFKALIADLANDFRASLRKPYLQALLTVLAGLFAIGTIRLILHPGAADLTAWRLWFVWFSIPPLVAFQIVILDVQFTYLWHDLKRLGSKIRSLWQELD